MRVINNPKLTHFSSKNLSGPGQRSRYSHSLRAGQSGDQIPVEARFSATDQTSPGAHPASYTVGIANFAGGKATRAWRWPPTPIQRRELCLYSLSGPSWPVPRQPLPLLLDVSTLQLAVRLLQFWAQNLHIRSKLSTQTFPSASTDMLSKYGDWNFKRLWYFLCI